MTPRISINRLTASTLEVTVGQVILFFSYNTLVATALNGEITSIDVPQSRTTKKHIGAWASDNASPGTTCTKLPGPELAKFAVLQVKKELKDVE